MGGGLDRVNVRKDGSEAQVGEKPPVNQTLVGPEIIGGRSNVQSDANTRTNAPSKDVGTDQLPVNDGGTKGPKTQVPNDAGTPATLPAGNDASNKKTAPGGVPGAHDNIPQGPNTTAPDNTADKPTTGSQPKSGEQGLPSGTSHPTGEAQKTTTGSDNSSAANPATPGNPADTNKTNPASSPSNDSSRTTGATDNIPKPSPSREQTPSNTTPPEASSQRSNQASDQTPSPSGSAASKDGGRSQAPPPAEQQNNQPAPVERPQPTSPPRQPEPQAMDRASSGSSAPQNRETPSPANESTRSNQKEAPQSRESPSPSNEPARSNPREAPPVSTSASNESRQQQSTDVSTPGVKVPPAERQNVEQGQRSDTQRSDQQRSDASRMDGTRADGSRTDASRSDAPRSDAGRPEHVKSEPSRSESSKAEPSRSDTPRGDTGRDGGTAGTSHSTADASREQSGKRDDGRTSDGGRDIKDKSPEPATRIESPSDKSSGIVRDEGRRPGDQTNFPSPTVKHTDAKIDNSPTSAAIVSDTRPQPHGVPERLPTTEGKQDPAATRTLPEAGRTSGSDRGAGSIAGGGNSGGSDIPTHAGAGSKGDAVIKGGAARPGESGNAARIPNSRIADVKVDGDRVLVSTTNQKANSEPKDVTAKDVQEKLVNAFKIMEEKAAGFKNTIAKTFSDLMDLLPVFKRADAQKFEQIVTTTDGKNTVYKGSDAALDLTKLFTDIKNRPADKAFDAKDPYQGIFIGSQKVQNQIVNAARRATEDSGLDATNENKVGKIKEITHSTIGGHEPAFLTKGMPLNMPPGLQTRINDAMSEKTPGEQSSAALKNMLDDRNPALNANDQIDEKPEGNNQSATPVQNQDDEQQSTHTVTTGQTASTIARDLLQDPNLAPLLCQLNPAVCDVGDMHAHLPPGQPLRLPTQAEILAFKKLNQFEIA